MFRPAQVLSLVAIMVLLPSCGPKMPELKRLALGRPLFGRLSGERSSASKPASLGAAAQIPRRVLHPPQVTLPSNTKYRVEGLWRKSHLTWKLSSEKSLPGRLDPILVKREIAQSFDMWAKAQVFTFAEAEEGETADIVISFDRPKEAAFDRNDCQIGYSFYPWTDRKGEIYLDPDRAWTTRSVGLIAETITDWLPHEIGHVLGLKHSDSCNNVMHPFGPFSTPNKEAFQSLRDLYNLLPHPPA